MIKLNNKGFAITGILYTLFILFLVILVSVLSGLSSKKRITSISLKKLEDSYIGILLDYDKLDDAKNTKIAPVTGKYIFKTNDDITCTSYLEKGTSLDTNITYVPKDCNEYELDLNLEEIYSFEEG